MQNNLNPYPKDEFREKFKKTDLFEKIHKDLLIPTFTDYLTFPKRMKIKRMAEKQDHIEPREVDIMGLFSVVPFYYLEFLTKHNPSKIYDLGCGLNLFKRYIPNIIGVDSNPLKKGFCDIVDTIDDEYIKNHQNSFESAFSICALHYIPLSDIRKRVIDFSSMISSGGHGFLALNLTRMLEVDWERFAEFSTEKLEIWVRTELDDLPFELQVFDLNFSVLECPLDGNIKLVFKK
jgi:hypothetical protein